MVPNIVIEFKIVRSTLAEIYDAAAEQMVAFLAGSGQEYSSERLDVYVDGDMLDVSTSSGYSSLPGKYTAQCVYKVVR